MARKILLFLSLVFFLESYSFSQTPPSAPPATETQVGATALRQPPHEVGQDVDFGRGSPESNILSTRIRYGNSNEGHRQIVITVTYVDGSTRHYNIGENGRLSVTRANSREARSYIAYVLPRVNQFPENVMERVGNYIVIHMGNGLDYRFSLRSGRISEIVGGGCVNDRPASRGALGFRIQAFRGLVIEAPEGNSEGHMMGQRIHNFTPTFMPQRDPATGRVVESQLATARAAWRLQAMSECANVAYNAPQITVRHRDSVSGAESTCRTSFSSLFEYRVLAERCNFITEGRNVGKAQCMCDPVFKTDINPATQQARTRVESDRLMPVNLVGGCGSMQTAYNNWQPHPGERCEINATAEEATREIGAGLDIPVRSGSTATDHAPSH